VTKKYKSQKSQKKSQKCHKMSQKVTKSHKTQKTQKSHKKSQKVTKAAHCAEQMISIDRVLKSARVAVRRRVTGGQTAKSIFMRARPTTENRICFYIK
jgi:LAS superfamily LD-carboxypeptidase LdcB